MDIDTSGNGNPFDFQLLRALESHPETGAVQHGTGWLYVPEYEPDVLHLHWPEALTGWKEPSDNELKKLAQAIRRLKRRAVVVATVHNEYPHYRDTTLFQKLYSMVYQEADGLIHMGEASKQVVRRRYAEEIGEAAEVVVPHGDYSWFPNDVSRETARAYFGLSGSEAVFACLGSIRHRDELVMLRRAFERVGLSGKRLILASRLPHSGSRDWRRYALRLPFWLSRSVHLDERFIGPKEVQYFLNAADVLVIPRQQTLNSGNVSLGFTFGRVVVGPATGVVGEVLIETGNPVFNDAEPASVAQAMEEGYALAGRGLGDQNALYARTHLDWSSIAAKHVDFYQVLVERHGRSVK